jgi:hypothetical protein
MSISKGKYKKTFLYYFLSKKYCFIDRKCKKPWEMVYPMNAQQRKLFGQQYHIIKTEGINVFRE